MTYEEIGTGNVENGESTINLNVGNDKQYGDYNLRATYQQNNTYKESTDTATLHLRKPVTVTVQRVTGADTDTVTLQATVNSGVTSVTSGQVQFKVGNSPVGQPVTLNGSSTATMNLTLNVGTNCQVGTNTLTAEYLLNNEYIGGTGTSELYVADELTITIQDTKFDYSNQNASPLQIPVEINADANKINGITATVTITGHYQGTVTTHKTETINDISGLLTGQNGYIEWDYDGNDWNSNENLDTEEFHITITTNQTEEYDDATATANITRRRDTTITGADLYANPGETVTITGNVKDEFNSTVTVGSVKVTLPGGTEQTITLAGDTFSINYQVPAGTTEGTSLTYKLKYIGGGNLNYCNSQENTYSIHIRTGTTLTLADVTTIIGSSVDLECSVEDTNENPVTTGTVLYEVDYVNA